MSLDVYVLGAGASWVHGAPLTDEILHYAITRASASNDKRIGLVKHFLREVFGFRAKRGKNETPAWRYPGLVDVLSVVDMAIDRKESLARGYDVTRLREVRHALEYAIYLALDHALSKRSRTGRTSNATRIFVQKMRKRHSAIISFNYDLLIDGALHRRLGPHDYGTQSLPTDANSLRFVDYGIHFKGTHERVEPAMRRFKLLKLHGSLNWLHDPLTGDVYFGGLRKTVGAAFGVRGRASHDLDRFFRRRPATELEPILVTPTHLKDLRSVHVSSLWKQAAEVLRAATSLTFIGYSLPGDDLHIKYLFKRGLKSRKDPLKKITLVNYVSPEEQERLRAKKEEPEVVQNYTRFFGVPVECHLDGFEPWVTGVMPSARR